jgi:hypothetical protein
LDEKKLEAVRDRCAELVMRYAGHQGFTHSDFFARSRAYRSLPNEEQFRVLVLLAKTPDVSSQLGIKRHIWRFYPRLLAPAGAFNYAATEEKVARLRDRDEAVSRAIDK